MTFREAYITACDLLKSAGIDDFKSDTDYIFEKCFGFGRKEMIFSGSREFPDEFKSKLFKVLDERKKKIPLQYILGTWTFMGIEFKVGEGVLIPRDDTTVLVQESLNKLKNLNCPKIVDLCSGTGCISIAIEKYLKNSPEIYAIEKSRDAYRYLTENVSIHSSKVKCINEDIFVSYQNFEDEYFDALISNPPYIKSEDMKNLQDEVKNEPQMALDGGEDGLYFYKNILSLWSSKIKKGGIIAFEIGQGQSLEVCDILNSNGFILLNVFKDINEIDRVIIGMKQN